MQAVKARYPLAREMIDALRERNPAPGRTVYILEAARGSEYGPVRIQVARRPLCDELEEYDPARYPTFRYQEYATEEAAYEAACRAFHHHGGEYGFLESQEHPVPPAGSAIRCPAPGCVHGGP